MRLSAREMSSFLMYRMTNPETFNIISEYFGSRIPIFNSCDLEDYLSSRVKDLTNRGGVALALSGGIDSAILAKYLPKGSTAYTFKCVVPGIKVIDETPVAIKYAEACGLKHKVVEIYWEDFEKYSDLLMINKGAPIHSIEVQIYKASLQARKDGYETLLFGEAADAVYGGLSGLLSKDWKVADFIERYSYLMPYKALRKPELPIKVYSDWERNGYIDPFQFVSNVFIQESVASYLNATQTAKINIALPYPETYMASPVDYLRIRAGENKYLIRELFARLYPGWPVPPKTPMPRPMNEWLKNWNGPQRSEFWENCAVGLSGDQKWLLWILERYLNL